MAVYPKYGLRKEDGVLISLVDQYGKPLPFLNSKASAKQGSDDMKLMLLRPHHVPDVAVSIKTGQVPTGFFPDPGLRFIVGTDDEETFEWRFVKESALHGLNFTRDGSRVQQYFRKRLNVSPDGDTLSSDFAKYGTDSFLMFRMDETFYYMDFSPDVGASPRQSRHLARREVLFSAKTPQYAARKAQEEARSLGLPFYPGRLNEADPLPELDYNLGRIIVVRRMKTVKGGLYEVAIERTQK